MTKIFLDFIPLACSLLVLRFNVANTHNVPDCQIVAGVWQLALKTCASARTSRVSQGRYLRWRRLSTSRS